MTELQKTILSRLNDDYEYNRDMAISFREDMRLIPLGEEDYEDARIQCEYFRGLRDGTKTAMSIVKEAFEDSEKSDLFASMGAIVHNDIKEYLNGGSK